MEYLTFALVGLAAGLLSGFVGVGGGLIIVPAMVLILGYSQLRAQGTSLAILLPPTGIFAFLRYWNNPEIRAEGGINLWAAGLMALCLLIAADFGAKLANQLDPVLVRRIFAAVMIASAIYLFFKK